MHFEEDIQEEKDFCTFERFLNGTETLNKRPHGTETQGTTTGGPEKAPANTHVHKTGRRT